MGRMHVENGLRRLARYAWRRYRAGVRWVMAGHRQFPASCSWSDVLGIATPCESASHHFSGDDRPSDKSQMMWRRRALYRKGADIRMGMSVNAREYSLAMLDEAGIVVSWHDDISPDQSPGLLDDVIDDHVRQFYVLADVAADVPRRDLGVAAVKGTCIGQGWRRRSGGSVYWGTTVINVVVNRQGRLQGFSHLTQRSARPEERTRSGPHDFTQASRDALGQGIRS